MYVSSQFAETRAEVMHDLIRGHSFGMLVTVDGDVPIADHLPFELDAGCAPLGVLRAHVARANPVWRLAGGATESLALFQGAQAYISPALYASKRDDGRVVPTYNYMVVHAYGYLRAVEDTAWVRALLERLSANHEMGRPEPWRLDDAPADYIEKLLPAIIGLELQITRLVGKWKVSQNQPLRNRLSVEAGLRSAGGESAAAMADAVARAREGA